MDDKEILKELSDQRDWWENQVAATEKKLKSYKDELARTNRLIELLQEKIRGN